MSAPLTPHTSLVSHAEFCHRMGIPDDSPVPRWEYEQLLDRFTALARRVEELEEAVEWVTGVTRLPGS